MRSLLVNENNIAIISPRRIGKTELINHVFDCDEFRTKYHCFLVDIYATQSVSDLVNMLGKAVLEEQNWRRSGLLGRYGGPCN